MSAKRALAHPHLVSSARARVNARISSLVFDGCVAGNASARTTAASSMAGRDGENGERQLWSTYVRHHRKAGAISRELNAKRQNVKQTNPHEKFVK